jgi:hypothetical protein
MYTFVCTHNVDMIRKVCNDRDDNDEGDGGDRDDDITVIYVFMCACFVNSDLCGVDYI